MSPDHHIFTIYPFSGVLTITISLVFGILFIDKIKNILINALKESLYKRWVPLIEENIESQKIMQDKFTVLYYTAKYIGDTLDDDKKRIDKYKDRYKRLLLEITNMKKDLIDIKKRGDKILEEYSNEKVDEVDQKIKSFTFFFGFLGILFLILGGIEYAYNYAIAPGVIWILFLTSQFFGWLIYQKMRFRLYTDNFTKDGKDSFLYFSALKISFDALLLTIATSLAIITFIVPISWLWYLPEYTATFAIFATVSTPLQTYLDKMRKSKKIKYFNIFLERETHANMKKLKRRLGLYEKYGTKITKKLLVDDFVTESSSTLYQKVKYFIEKLFH